MAGFPRMALARLVALGFLALAVLWHAQPVQAQQMAYLVNGSDGRVSVFNLTDSSLLEEISAGPQAGFVALSPNNRIGYVGTQEYLSIVDLTIGQEIRRIQQTIPYGAGTLSADGKFLYFVDAYSYSIDVLDTSTFQITRRVGLFSILGDGTYQIGTIILRGNSAYVIPSFPDPVHPAFAIINLTTFALTAVSMPAGYFNGTYAAPGAAITADGTYLVIALSEYDGSNHLLFYLLSNNQLALDKVTSNIPEGIAIAQTSDPSQQYGYVVGYDPQNSFNATVLDLKPGSPTYGQLLPQTEVHLGFMQDSSGAALTPDNTSLVISGFQPYYTPQPNIYVLNTGLMLTNPNQAIVGSATASSGSYTWGLALGPVATTPPPTAPQVTGVSGNVTNNAPTTIHVTGANFLNGAFVRIGNMDPLPATVNSPSDLQVTVPANAPAANGLDVIVTNPESGQPLQQQNQSGLLSSGISIYTNPAFQPQYQFATVSLADGSMSAFDFGTRTMTTVMPDVPVRRGLTFNLEGSQLYAPSTGPLCCSNAPLVVGLDLATFSEDGSISFPQGSLPLYQGVAPGRNIATGGSVVYTALGQNSNYDLILCVIDTDPSSPTFNTIIETIGAGLDAFLLRAYALAATPDGKFVYVAFTNDLTGEAAIAIYDIVQQSATIISDSSLGITSNQVQVSVTPDGKSLLLGGIGPVISSLPGSLKVFDLTDPTNPTLVTTIYPPTPAFAYFGPPSFHAYQVVGDHLFTLETASGAIIVYSFNRQTNDFSKIASYTVPGHSLGNYSFMVTPDGAFIYVPVDDQVTVLDANALLNHQPALITNIATGKSAWYVAASPTVHTVRSIAPSNIPPK